jgi:hypothetical protein
VGPLAGRHDDRAPAPEDFVNVMRKLQQYK